MTLEWWFAYLLTSIILSLSPGLWRNQHHDHLAQPRLSRRGGVYCWASDRTGDSYCAGWRGVGDAIFPLSDCV